MLLLDKNILIFSGANKEGGDSQAGTSNTGIYFILSV